MSRLWHKTAQRAAPALGYTIAIIALIAGVVLGFGNSLLGGVSRTFSVQDRIGAENSRITTSLGGNMYGIPQAQADAASCGGASCAAPGCASPSCGGYCSCGCGCGCGCGGCGGCA